jgi:hypothetical protein
LAAVAWLVFGIPHLIVHSAHLDMFGTVDQIGNVASLGGTVVLAMLLLVPTTESSKPSETNGE